MTRATPTAEHWLDRLAVRATRRQVLKAALGGVALTFPFAIEPRSAAAADPKACRRGCLQAADTNSDRGFDACLRSYVKNAGRSLFVVLYLNPVVGFGAVTAAAAKSVRCVDGNILNHKAASRDCLQPDCSGFDPKGPGGPCEGMAGPCCPCSGCASGYVPCITTGCCNKNGTGCAFGSDCGA